MPTSANPREAAGSETNHPDRISMPREIAFLPQQSASEKEAADHHAAIVLELTARNSCYDDRVLDNNLSDAGPSVPSFVEIGALSSSSPLLPLDQPRSPVQECDMITNVDDLPHAFAIAEMVSVCQERDTRLEFAEAMNVRLEALTRHLIAQQQQYLSMTTDSASMVLPPFHTDSDLLHHTYNTYRVQNNDASSSGVALQLPCINHDEGNDDLLSTNNEELRTMDVQNKANKDAAMPKS